ncbi:MAG: dimethyl sulfoxide reductase anchor subunit [Eggerthellales bacterium]|nr:dimethyl sulfoxide reductase anchor subunit [Eggerthellales bacterium]
MFFEHVMSELPLLVFSVLVPAGVTAMGLVGFLRGSVEMDGKKANTLLAIPGVIAILGLLASFMHLGSPMKVFGMLSGIGSSPLSNEICIAGLAILAAVVYWIFAAVKNPEAGVHKIFGIICLVLGLATALFIGLAYMIPTVATWSSPVSSIAQIFAALFGGAALAALVMVFAGAKVEKLVSLVAVVGAAGMAVLVIAQGIMVGDVQNAAGMAMAGRMSFYWYVAVAGIILIAAAAALLLTNAGKKSSLTTVLVLVAAFAAIVGMVLVRMCFYGIFMSVGLF